MTRRVSVSYNFNDKQIAHGVNEFERQGAAGWTFVRVERDVSHGHATHAARDRAIDNEIRYVMDGCGYALFLIGDDTRNSPWILREIELATSKGLRKVVARVRGTTGGAPSALARHRVVKFEPQAVVDALEGG